MMDEDDWYIAKKLAACILLLALAVFCFFYFIDPFISVWQQSKKGEAELAKAEFTRQIAICEANAKRESAKALSEAEVIRAEGVAKANKIIGESLTNNEGYLRYLYINHLSESDSKTVIYIPTEAGLPILESTRLREGQ